MIEFMKDVWNDSKWLFSLFTSLFLLLVFVCFWGLNFISYKSQPNKAIVIGRSYTPGMVTTTFVMSGKTMIPVTTIYPEHWDIGVIRPDKTTASCPCSEQMYNDIHNGSRCKIIDHYGIITHTISRTDLISYENN